MGEGQPGGEAHWALLEITVGNEGRNQGVLHRSLFRLPTLPGRPMECSDLRRQSLAGRKPPQEGAADPTQSLHHSLPGDVRIRSLYLSLGVGLSRRRDSGFP